MKWVFDLDDTLYLERDFVRSGFQAVGKSTGIPGFFEAAWGLFEQGERGDVFDQALSLLEVPGDVVGMVAVYRAHRPSIALAPDARRLLEWIQGAAGLISDGPAATQQNKLEALGIAGRFQSVVLTGAWGATYSKPHPRAFLETQRRLGPGPYVYVADNPTKDFETPRKLGWRTIRVRRQEGLYAAARGVEAEWTVATLNDIRSVVAGESIRD